LPAAFAFAHRAFAAAAIALRAAADNFRLPVGFDVVADAPGFITLALAQRTRCAAAMAARPLAEI
jgi:hypothetical protein